MFTKLAPAHRSRGVSLIEVLVASAISSLLFTTVSCLTFYSSRAISALSNYVDLSQHSRLALDTISRDIRQAKEILAFDDHRLLFSTSSNQTMEIVYHSDNRQLLRKTAGVSEVLLPECGFFQISCYQRNPALGSGEFNYKAGSPITAKLVQINWVCSREVLGRKVNSQKIETAKIVVRNQ